VPKQELRGIQITRQGRASYIEEFQARQDPRQQDYYWLTGEKKELEKDQDVDDWAIQENKIRSHLCIMISLIIPLSID